MEKEQYKDPYKRVELPKSTDDFVYINCPSCGHKASSNDLNINDKIAKCGSCDAVFSFEKELLPLLTKKELLQKPVGVDEIYFGKDLELAMNKPMRPWEIVGLMLSPAVTFFSGLIYYKEDILFALILALISGMIFTYYLIKTVKKRQEKVFFTCHENQLVMEWENERAIKPLVFQTNELDQLYVTRTHNGFALKAILNTTSGQEHKLLIDGLKTTMDLKYIEQQIEAYYGLPNRKVATEIG